MSNSHAIVAQGINKRRGIVIGPFVRQRTYKEGYMLSNTRYARSFGAFGCHLSRPTCCMPLQYRAMDGKRFARFSEE